MGYLDIKILKNEIDEKRFINKGWGNNERVLTDEHIKALKEGKKIGFYDGEYTTIVSYKDNQ